MAHDLDVEDIDDKDEIDDDQQLVSCGAEHIADTSGIGWNYRSRPSLRGKRVGEAENEFLRASQFAFATSVIGYRD